MKIGPSKFRRMAIDHIPIASIREVKRLVDIIEESGRTILDEHLRTIDLDHADTNHDILTKLRKGDFLAQLFVSRLTLKFGTIAQLMKT